MRTQSRWSLQGIALGFILLLTAGMSSAQSPSLPSDRGRVVVSEVPDAIGGPPLKVLRTDQKTPLRAGTAWIWSKQWLEEPAEYYAAMRGKGLNAVRIILFDTWEMDAGYLVTDWNDPTYRATMLARIERAVNFASLNGMYAIINSHGKIPSFNSTYDRALWTHVAPFFKDRSHVLFEAWNEPLEGTLINGQGEYSGDLAKLRSLKTSYNHIRSLAPSTHVMVLTPAGVSGWGFVDGLARVTAKFESMAGPPIDWTKTSVAYHLYHADENLFPLAQNLRDFHSKYPAWPSENNFPKTVSSTRLGIPADDTWRSVSFGTDEYLNQTCERYGLGWSHWHINRLAQLESNFSLLWDDAVSKGYAWQPDAVVNQVGSINAGGPHLKGISADINYFGGKSASWDPSVVVETSGVADAINPKAYQTERWGDFSYQFAKLMPRTPYRVRLHFCESYTAITEPGQRLFDVSINGVKSLDRFDTFAAAGSKRNKAVVRTLVATSDASGRILIAFKGVVQNAKVNAIEILPSTGRVRFRPGGVSQ